MKKTKVKKHKKVRILLSTFVSLFIISSITFVIGKNVIDIYNKNQEKKELEESLYSLKEKEVELKTEVEKLQDPEYVARFAREKYFYSKNGEIILIMPEK